MIVSVSPSASNFARAVSAVIEAGRVPATSGNFSARTDKRSFAVTCSGVEKGMLNEDDLPVNAPGYVLAGHGLDAWGRDPREAWRRLEALETLFQTNPSHEELPTMTRLIITSAADPKDASLDTEDFGVIAGELAALGARIERWQATHPLPPNASQAEILAAYAPEIERLKTRARLPGRRRRQHQASHPELAGAAAEVPDRAHPPRRRGPLFRRGQRRLLYPRRRPRPPGRRRGRRSSLRPEGDAALVRRRREGGLHLHPRLHRPGRLGGALHRRRHLADVPAVRQGRVNLTRPRCWTDRQAPIASSRTAT